MRRSREGLRKIWKQDFIGSTGVGRGPGDDTAKYYSRDMDRLDRDDHESIASENGGLG